MIASRFSLSKLPAWDDSKIARSIKFVQVKLEPGVLGTKSGLNSSSLIRSCERFGFANPGSVCFLSSKCIRTHHFGKFQFALVVAFQKGPHEYIKSACAYDIPSPGRWVYNSVCSSS